MLLSRRTPLLRLLCLASWCGAVGCSAGVEFEHVFALDSAESVFAYSRISPDGNALVFASYARDLAHRTPYSQTLKIVDLRTHAVAPLGLGVDGYWSPDGERLIYLSFDHGAVAVRETRSGATTHAVAPESVGDYYSWGERDGQSIILTAQGNYFSLSSTNVATLPAAKVPPCARIGSGDRPLLSKDGRRITTFVEGRVFVRNLTDCRDVIDVGIEGGKADFSWDGRFIAFHALKPTKVGYEIKIVDLEDRTVRTISLPLGSALFPSWTRDGRLSFRYDGDDYRGFIVARNVFSAPTTPMSSAPAADSHALKWADIFPETERPRTRLNLVVIWAPWSAHSPLALDAAQTLEASLRRDRVDANVLLAADPESRAEDRDRLLLNYGITLRSLPLSPSGFALTEARNQIPTILLFRDDDLVGRRLGAQERDVLRQWIDAQRALLR